jgi:hypothetical protein
MVDAVIDVVRIPTITLSEEELDDIEARIAKGDLPPDFLDRHYDAVDKNVFGHDFKKDKKGNPIEQGIGSPGNMTQNSINAFKKFNHPPAGAGEAEVKEFTDAVKRMEADLVACNEQRAISGARRRRRVRR